MNDKLEISKQFKTKMLITTLILIIIASISTVILLTNSVMITYESGYMLQTQGALMLVVYFVGFGALLGVITITSILLTYACNNLGNTKLIKYVKNKPKEQKIEQ